MKSRLRLEHHPILIQLRENGRDLALAKGIVERVIEYLRRDTEARGGAAVYHQARQQPLVLLIIGDIPQHRQGLELLHEPGCPFAELLGIGIFQTVLKLRPAYTVFDRQVLHRLHEQRDTFDFGQTWLESADHGTRAELAFLEGL